MQWHINRSALAGKPLADCDAAAFGGQVLPGVREHLAAFDYRRTPLHDLPALAAGLGLARIAVKDEGSRSSLGSFKALGGTHAVVRVVLAEAGRALGRLPAAAELHSETVRRLAAAMTVTCATDGNHGRAVAAGAALAGCRAVIFIHAGVSEARAQAIREQGAEVVRVAGNYDDSVAEAGRIAARRGWLLVSDTSWPGYEQVPTWVMQGYLVMASEALEQFRAGQGGTPTHVFLQAGVGGYAAAVAAHLSLALGDEAPRFIVVEPERAACLYRSAVAGVLTRIPADEPTVMAMLECYEPSLIGWRILERVAHGFLAIGEESALRAMRALARPRAGDPAVRGGESGGAGLAGLMAAAGSADARRDFGLDESSSVLLFNTEGATDPDLYDALLAREDAHDRAGH